MGRKGNNAVKKIRAMAQNLYLQRGVGLPGLRTSKKQFPAISRKQRRDYENRMLRGPVMRANVAPPIPLKKQLRTQATRLILPGISQNKVRNESGVIRFTTVTPRTITNLNEGHHLYHYPLNYMTFAGTALGIAMRTSREWRVKSMYIEYKTSVGLGSEGNIVGIHIADPDDMLLVDNHFDNITNIGGSSCPVWDDGGMKVRCDHRNKKWLDVDPIGELKTNTLGNFCYATEGCSAGTTYGYFLLHYDVELRGARLVSPHVAPASTTVKLAATVGAGYVGDVIRAADHPSATEHLRFTTDAPADVDFHVHRLKRFSTGDLDTAELFFYSGGGRQVPHGHTMYAQTVSGTAGTTTPDEGSDMMLSLNPTFTKPVSYVAGALSAIVDVHDAMYCWYDDMTV